MDDVNIQYVIQTNEKISTILVTIPMLLESPLSGHITDAGLVIDNDCDCVMCLYILYPDNDSSHYPGQPTLSLFMTT